MSSRRPQRKPRIGLNMAYKPERNDVQGVSYIFESYTNSVAEAGAIPDLLPLCCNFDVILEKLDDLDGIVFVGGGDLDPRNDGYMLHPYTRPMPSEREKFDRALMREVARRRLPVLAIGVGMQLLNVEQGGALFLHIPDDVPHAFPHRDALDPYHRHGLVIEKNSLLDRVYGENDVRVASAHHMAVDDVAPNFLVSARCPGDNVVEAIESTYEDWLAVGVQFHPESIAASVLDRRIFHEFVKGVEEYRQTGRNPFLWTPVKPERSQISEKSRKNLYPTRDASSEITLI
ncbi:MAG: gamma-glutamyl-gamma-aminobutyrate hydrolase family protein [Thermoguttaceae bacterium]|nr:gamma-glutamyl-gamma-aminobutyrate hydrolase family protein [Thermoguttaceae bacterium]